MVIVLEELEKITVRQNNVLFVAVGSEAYIQDLISLL